MPSLLDRMDAGQMATVLSDPIVRAAHVDAIREFADDLEADGIDIDMSSSHSLIAIDMVNDAAELGCVHHRTV